MTDCINIPTAVFQDERYKQLRTSEKILLLELYVDFFDTALFTPDFPDSIRTMQLARLKRLVDIGFVVLDHIIPAKRGYGKRVFRLAYRPDPVE